MATRLNPNGTPSSAAEPEEVVPSFGVSRPDAESSREAVKLPPLPELGEFEDKVLQDAVGETHAPELREDHLVRGWYRVLKEIRTHYEKRVIDLKAIKKPLEIELNQATRNRDRYNLRVQIQKIEEARHPGGPDG